MTQTYAEPQSSSASVAERLREARERAGLTLDDAVSATGLLRSYLMSLEAGRRRPLPREIDRLAAAYCADLSDVLPRRRPVSVDLATGRLVLGGAERTVGELAGVGDVHAAYLSLLRSVRGARPGQRIALRSSDLDLLGSLLGDDPDRIEQRLVQLMGCTPDDASLLRGVLLRHRAFAAAAGAAAALTMVVTAGGDAQVDVLPSAPATAGSTPLTGGSSSAAYFPPEDGEDGEGAGEIELPAVQELVTEPTP